jgi:hypothetical protein
MRKASTAIIAPINSSMGHEMNILPASLAALQPVDQPLNPPIPLGPGCRLSRAA